MELTKKIIFDLNNEIYTKIDAKQNDIKSRYIEFTLTNSGVAVDLTGHTVKIFAVKVDNTLIFNNVQITDATNGKVLVELTNQALAVVGELQCELCIYGTDNSVLSSKVFTINVLASIRNDSAVESTNEFTALTEAIAKLNGWDQQFQSKYDGLNAQYAQQLTSNTNKLGILSNLNTTNKTDLVQAINENTSQLADIAINIKKFANLIAPTNNTYNLDVSTLNDYMLNNRVRYLIPIGTYIINKPILIPYGVSIIGHGMESVIKADFSNWVGTDHRALIVQGREGQTYGNIFNPIIKDFNIDALHSDLVKGIGVFIGTDTVIDSSVAVAYSFTNGLISNISVSKFDCAYYIQECWGTQLENIMSIECKNGISIIGKSVNVGITCNLTNFTNNYTSDKTDSIGIHIDSKLNYSNGEGRPEGITIKPSSLIFGAKTDLLIERGLQIVVDKSIIDGATGNAVELGSPDSVLIDGCYLYATGNSNSCINLKADPNLKSKINITNNNFVGTNALSAIYSMVNYRYGVTIKGNSIQGFSNPIQVNYFNNGVIEDNLGINNTGAFIYCQSDCDGTIIDKNNSKDNFPILLLHSTISKNLIIGSNISNNSKTFARGNISVNVGDISKTITLSSQGETQYRYIGKCITTNVSSGVVIQNGLSQNTLTFNFVSATASFNIFYEISAVPITVFS